MSISAAIKKTLGNFQMDVSFETENEIMGLLGASGCGKSMTLKCIAGVETPDSGRIVLDGRILFDSDKNINLTPQERKIGYLFQQYALFPNMTVAKNILMGAHTMEKSERNAAVSEMIERLQLKGLENKRPGQLSGGQQQRVALARIMINRPQLIMLDEPFSALDSYLKWQLELELLNTLKDFSGTTLFVTHNRDEVYRICNTVCVLTGGLSEPQLPVKKLFEAPPTKSACLISGCKNFSRILRLGDYKVEALDWGTSFTVTNPVSEDAAFLGVRAHYFNLVSGPGDNTFKCKINQVIDDVFSTVVIMQTPGGNSSYSLLNINLPKEKWAALGDPTEVYLYVEPKDVMILNP